MIAHVLFHLSNEFMKNYKMQGSVEHLIVCTIRLMNSIIHEHKCKILLTI